MSNERKSFRTGQTVTITHTATVGEGELAYTEVFGTEQAEIIGVVAAHGAPGMVNVRPFNSDDIIAVHIKNISA